MSDNQSISDAQSAAEAPNPEVSNTLNTVIILGLVIFVLAGFFTLSHFMGGGGNLDAGLIALDNQDYATAFDELQPLAEKGNADAQYLLGWMYDSGRGVEQSNAEAFRWYSIAAEQGHPKAQNNLGVMYATGQGVRRNLTKAVEWYSKAAAQGNDNAVASLADLQRNSRNNSEQYLIEEINPAGADAVRRNESIRMQAVSAKCQMLRNAFDPSSPLGQRQLAQNGCL